MQARLTLARSMPDVQAVGIATSQHSMAFFARFGFRLTGQTPDGFGPGLDCCEMILPLPPIRPPHNLSRKAPRAGVPRTDLG